jgi:AcrR family transcriptional regulator
MTSLLRFVRREEPAEGLRSRKKAKTRIMIEDAALRLFAEQGYEATTVEQITATVDISTTTFFRYFPTKADVVLCQQDVHLPMLREAILSRPPEENELDVLWYAIRCVWVPNIDPEHTLRAASAVAGSASLRGLLNDVNRGWLDAVIAMLAERRGLAVPDLRAAMSARIALGAFNEAVRTWTKIRNDEPIGRIIEEAFDTVKQLVGEWGETKREMEPK